MITKIIRIQCDNCNALIIEDECSKKDAVNHAMLFNGMEKRRVPNGSKWMLCYTCSKLKTTELR